jgi:hypothetical protein|nr:MAG TPA: hypothetical protein [Bacteriophage sp.]
MKNNDFPTNPVAFAQYVWENIEVGDILVDRFRDFWKVTSWETCIGRKIRINICRISNKSGSGYNNGEYEKLTRYDLARKYYFYINNIAVEIPDVEDWNAGTFVQNYNTLWYILDTMVPITKEETSDMYALFLLTQEADKIYEENNEKISTIRTLNELKNKFEKRDYYDGDKIREKCVNCLPKEDKKMTENEKNYFPKNKGKTGVDTQLKSAFYSQEELDEAIRKIDDFLETHANTAKNKCKESVKKFTDFSDKDLDEICTRVVDTFYSASDFSKKAFCDFRNWWRENHKDDEVKVKESKKEPENKTETLKVNNNSVITVDNNEVDTKKNKVNNTDVEKPKPVFKLGDVVYTKGESVGYISRIGYTDRYCYYYWTPIIISSNDKTLKDEEIGLTYPYETHYKRIGNYLMSDLNCVKKMARIDSVYKLSEDNLKKFPYLDKYVNDFKDKENSTTTDTLTPSSNRKTGSTDSLPKYLSKLHLTDSAYSYEVNTKLTTDIVRKLNEVIEALDDIILYHLNEAQEKT